MSFESPLYDKKKSVGENLEELYFSVGGMANLLNKERSTKEDNIIIANGEPSGTVTVPLDTAKYRVLIAVVYGAPVLCALYKGMLSGRGHGEYISGTLAGTRLSYSASGRLDALIAVF